MVIKTMEPRITKLRRCGGLVKKEGELPSHLVLHIINNYLAESMEGNQSEMVADVWEEEEEEEGTRDRAVVCLVLSEMILAFFG